MLVSREPAPPRAADSRRALGQTPGGTFWPTRPGPGRWLWGQGGPKVTSATRGPGAGSAGRPSPRPARARTAGRRGPRLAPRSTCAHAPLPARRWGGALSGRRARARRPAGPAGPRSRESLSRGSAAAAAAAAMGHGAPGAGGARAAAGAGAGAGRGRGAGARPAAAHAAPVSPPPVCPAPRPSSPAPPQLGPWSWRGCRTVPLDALRTRCLCDRLSTFAILAQLSADAVRPRPGAWRAGGGARGGGFRGGRSPPGPARGGAAAHRCPPWPGQRGLGLWRGRVGAEWVAVWSWGLALKESGWGPWEGLTGESSALSLGA